MNGPEPGLGVTWLTDSGKLLMDRWIDLATELSNLRLSKNQA
jgi:hypothetical protein